MLIRILPIPLLAVVACADVQPPPDAPTVPTPATGAPPPQRDRGDAFCDHRHYQCLPNQPGAQAICDEACLFPSHCQDYGPGAYRYCAAHPDSFDAYYRYCDPQGNPAWETYCVAGPRP